MSFPEPFTINIPQIKIDVLNQKLALAEFPDELDGSAWDLGCPLSEVKRLVTTWKHWDWRKAEKTLNEYPHFHSDIDIDGFGSLDIHFLCQKSSVKGAIPLLFVHGWPGCFLEVLKILPLLTQHNVDGPVFDVIAPSLPNFGFSQGVSKRGFALAQYAETCHKLMLKLGYTEYVTQAGDWGFWITRAIGKLYPASCKASHVNMILAKPPSVSNSPLLTLKDMTVSYNERDREAVRKTEVFQREGRGYNILQSTRPQTVAYALNDSPVALLSWIYEKLHDWADNYPWTDDEILTWISIYQFSHAGPGASTRIYYETMHTPETGSGKTFTYDEILQYTPGVKYGLAFNPMELEMVPKIWARTLGEVVYEVENEHGGHFYAHEHPELLVRDLKAMFGRGGVAYGLIKGRDGYAAGD